MSDTIEFCCELNSTDTSAPLGMEILLNDISKFKIDHITQTCEIKFDIDDVDATQKLQFVLFGKTADHTKLDAQGNIVADALVKINSITIDGIDIDQLFIDRNHYSHNFNGTQSTTAGKFYGSMGCNGTVTFEFSTPIYLWLLENM